MVAKIISDIKRDSKHKRIAAKLLSRLSKVQQNDNEELKIQHIGEGYTEALFSPVSAIMCAMAEVYGTFNLPVYSIDTNDLPILDLTKDSAQIKIIIGTSQPGLMTGENNVNANALIKRLAEVFNVREQQILLHFILVQNVHVVDF